MYLPLYRRNINNNNSLPLNADDSVEDANSADDESSEQTTVVRMAYLWLLAMIVVFFLCEWLLKGATNENVINDAMHWGDENFFAMAKEEEEDFQMSRVEHFMSGWVDR
mmetsp:Transcript_20720/g.31174  ORF Transcript_20720/g.31174 Transcript_20720/m.31174 type:complete len:109 (-) Transcript_20720:693-1019(-)|eukprot:CAMPEP_0178921506 /NCGR_PEP_ID=MMETSP0786-20121207/15601_1 /TAXON_ID=186022 /ORGANISM="Thalassionema frauenfeldii, Strain CCMP 1798" /LENGTH=108 /DNA_ID=CAMNT_0020595697 /DNA_START=105 /DNA_END=431 /DNA_ORIENTATION=-